MSQEDVSDKLDVRLRKDVKLLGGILGRTIEKHSGGLKLEGHAIVSI